MSGHKTRQKFIGTKFCSGFVFHLSHRMYFNLFGKHPQLHCYILQNVSPTQEEEERGEMHHHLSECTEAPVQVVHHWYFIRPRFPVAKHSTAVRNLIFDVFSGWGGSDVSPSQPPKGGDTAELSRVQSRDRGTGAHSFTCSGTPVRAAILHFSSK